MNKILGILKRITDTGKTSKITGENSEEYSELSIVDRLFDNVIRNIGYSDSRRQAVKYGFTGLVGAAFYDFGLKTLWAADNCLCNGRIYDPDTECCITGTVQIKNPISDLDLCPDRVPHPGHTCVSNGCGAEGGRSFPGSFGNAEFTPCCNDHDCCYGECNSNRGGCDTTFEECMTAACDAAYPGSGYPDRLKRSSCRGAANTYWAAVAAAGQAAYDAAQRAACDCCESSSCAEQCDGGGSCGLFPSCEGGADCFCFAAVEGGGACAHGDTPCDGIQTCTSSSECPSGYACLNATCCGTEAVCAPLCSAVTPVLRSRSASIQEQRLTISGWKS